MRRAVALALALVVALPGRARAQTPTAVAIFPTEPPPPAALFLPYTRADPLPTATPRPTAAPAHAPWRNEWRRRTAQEVVDQFRRDGLAIVGVFPESRHADGVHYDSLGIRFIGYRPDPEAADFIVIDCYSKDTRLTLEAAMWWDTDVTGRYHRNIFFMWAEVDPRPDAYIASYMADCEADPHCDPLDPE